MVANLYPTPPKRGRPKLADHLLTPDALRMRRNRAGEKSAKYKARKRQAHRIAKDDLLGPGQTWDHWTHGFTKCGLIDPVLINDGHRFAAGCRQFWERRGLEEPLGPISWDYDWLNKI